MKLSICMIGFALLLSACGGQKLRELGKELEMSPVGTGMKYSNASQVMAYPTQPKKRVSEFSLWSDHKSALFQDIIEGIDISDFNDKPIIIKGCANKPIPPSAFSILIERIQPVAKTIMYGEACSTVPLYKAKK